VRLDAQRSLAVQRFPEWAQDPPQKPRPHRDQGAFPCRPHAIAGGDAREFAQGHEKYLPLAETDNLGGQGAAAGARDVDQLPDGNFHPPGLRHQARDAGNVSRDATERAVAEAITKRAEIDHGFTPRNNRLWISDV
jgi:hypothetical protein